MNHEKLKAVIEDLCLGEVFAESELASIAEAAIQDDGRLARAVNDALERAAVAIRNEIKFDIRAQGLGQAGENDGLRKAAAIVRGMKEELQ